MPLLEPAHGEVAPPTAAQPSRGTRPTGGATTPLKAKPRILFAINSLAGGGAERVFTSLIAASEKRRSEFEIGVGLLDEDPPGYSLPNWITPFRLDCGHRFIRSIARFDRLVASWKPDLTLSFLTRANVASALTMSIRGLPCIISERTNTRLQLTLGGFSGLKMQLVRAAYRRAANVIAVSQGVASALETHFAVNPARLRVINNPVDAADVREKAKDDPPFSVGPEDVVVMGRLVREKNFALAIRAFAKSDWQGRLVLLGEGPLAAELAALATHCNVRDRVIFAGFQSNPHAVIARAGTFLLASNQEGFSNSLVEAMAVGTPVVATDCQFSPAEILAVTRTPSEGEVIRGDGGLLVAINDEPALVRALNSAKDPIIRGQLSAEGRKRVAEFDGKHLFDRYWDVVEEVMQRVQGGPSDSSRAQSGPGIRVRQAG